MINYGNSVKKQHIFTVASEDGVALIQSKVFSAKADAHRIAQKMLKHKEEFFSVHRSTDYDGYFRFKVVNREGLPIAMSRRFYSEAGMENGIQYFKNRISQLDPDTI